MRRILCILIIDVRYPRPSWQWEKPIPWAGSRAVTALVREEWGLRL